MELIRSLYWISLGGNFMVSLDIYISTLSFDRKPIFLKLLSTISGYR